MYTFFAAGAWECTAGNAQENFYVLHKTCHHAYQHVLFGVTSCILFFCYTASPCISHVNCSGVISRASDAVPGHWKCPASSLL